MNNRVLITSIRYISLRPLFSYAKWQEISTQGLRRVISVLNIEVERLRNTRIETLNFRVTGHRQVAQGVK